MGDDMSWAEYQEFSAQVKRETHTAPAVLYFVDAREPWTGIVERQRSFLLFESATHKLTIFRKFLTALDPGDSPGELRFTVEGLPLKSIVLKPARELGWIYWAAGR
ncbi:hypothetical protein ACFCWG_33065 [Streptomyces sp. NPDC056390]|uniref:hypothetical protein n=1 Tax=Streptomyces sp. NPDC056390 TaxID=3345806 RepID=UPI0035D97CF5